MPAMYTAMCTTILLLSWIAAHQIIDSGIMSPGDDHREPDKPVLLHPSDPDGPDDGGDDLHLLVIISRASTGRIAAVLRELITTPAKPVSEVKDGSYISAM